MWASIKQRPWIGLIAVALVITGIVAPVLHIAAVGVGASVVAGTALNVGLGLAETGITTLLSIGLGYGVAKYSYAHDLQSLHDRYTSDVRSENFAVQERQLVLKQRFEVEKKGLDQLDKNVKKRAEQLRKAMAEDSGSESDEKKQDASDDLEPVTADHFNQQISGFLSEMPREEISRTIVYCKDEMNKIENQIVAVNSRLDVAQREVAQGASKLAQHNESIARLEREMSEYVPPKLVLIA